MLRDEDDNVLVFDDGASTEAPMSFGEIVLEDTDTAEVTLRRFRMLRSRCLKTVINNHTL